jgi:hypothetical protein
LYFIVTGPVESLSPTVIGSNFVELTWKKPELLNSPIAVISNSYLQGYDNGKNQLYFDDMMMNVLY